MGTDDRSYITPRLHAWRARTDVPLLVLAIGSVPLLLSEIIRDELSVADQRFLDVVNVIVLVAFAVDDVVEVNVASDRQAYVRGELLGLAVVVAQAAALVPSLAAFGALRALRAVRVVRLRSRHSEGRAVPRSRRLRCRQYPGSEGQLGWK